MLHFVEIIRKRRYVNKVDSSILHYVITTRIDGMNLKYESNYMFYSLTLNPFSHYTPDI